MAVKNDITKNYSYPLETVIAALRHPKFGGLLDAPLKEEAKDAEGVEFRFIRKSDAARYGRNYFVRPTSAADGSTDVKVIIQSRKVTVLLDPKWKNEAERVFNALDVMLEVVAK